VEKKEGVNTILAQAHFIKTVEDVYEALVTSCPGIRFGLAFNESSGPRLIRTEGNSEEMIHMAQNAAMKIGAGHLLVIMLENAFPINVIRHLREVAEILCIYCATANPLSVVVASEGEARGVMGVLDGLKPLGVEGDKEKKERHEFLRHIGYKR